ncbi:MAG TPA: GTPase RsgA, partial [Gemmataceae bacterium]|nr:GTPase RsgA [Gemmataceae bacterium]
MAKKKKTRVDLRKNRSKPPRQQGWTRGFQEHGYAEDATINNERVRAKGDLSRKRTIIQEKDAGAGDLQTSDMPATASNACLPGRVLRVHGLHSYVQTDDGRLIRCAVRRLLKTLATEERSIVATGDRVWIRMSGDEGMIERVEPRHGILTRSSRGREHVIVANVDQVVIVVSLLEPELKPHLIDRYLASAAQGGIAPIVCLNKSDLVDV